MRNILVRRGVYPWTISPEPRKDLGSPTENYVRTADAIESRSLYVGHICLKRVIGWHLGWHLSDIFIDSVRAHSFLLLFLQYCLKSNSTYLLHQKKTANKVTVFNWMGWIIVLDGSVALLPEQQPLLFPFAWQLPLRRPLHLLGDHSGVSVSAILDIHVKKNIAQAFILERYFFVCMLGMSIV